MSPGKGDKHQAVSLIFHHNARGVGGGLFQAGLSKTPVFFKLATIFIVRPFFLLLIDLTNTDLSDVSILHQFSV